MCFLSLQPPLLPLLSQFDLALVVGIAFSEYTELGFLVLLLVEFAEEREIAAVLDIIVDQHQVVILPGNALLKLFLRVVINHLDAVLGELLAVLNLVLHYRFMLRFYFLCHKCEYVLLVLLVPGYLLDLQDVLLELLKVQEIGLEEVYDFIHSLLVLAFQGRGQPLLLEFELGASSEHALLLQLLELVQNLLVYPRGKLVDLIIQDLVRELLLRFLEHLLLLFHSVQLILGFLDFLIGRMMLSHFGVEVLAFGTLAIFLILTIRLRIQRVHLTGLQVV